MHKKKRRKYRYKQKAEVAIYKIYPTDTGHINRRNNIDMHNRNTYITHPSIQKTQNIESEENMHSHAHKHAHTHAHTNTHTQTHTHAYSY